MFFRPQSTTDANLSDWFREWMEEEKIPPHLFKEAVNCTLDVSAVDLEKVKVNGRIVFGKLTQKAVHRFATKIVLEMEKPGSLHVMIPYLVKSILSEVEDQYTRS